MGIIRESMSYISLRSLRLNILVLYCAELKDRSGSDYPDPNLLVCT